MCNNQGFVQFSVMESIFIFSQFNQFQKTQVSRQFLGENDNRYLSGTMYPTLVALFKAFQSPRSKIFTILSHEPSQEVIKHIGSGTAQLLLQSY